MSDHINVSVRLRPPLEKEIREKLKINWTVENGTIYLLENEKKTQEGCTFDNVFDMNSKNEDIYNAVVQPVVKSAVGGINGTVFAYGQTSSGKTHTMSGTPMDPGIISFTVNDLLKFIKSDADRKYLLRVSYIEIYNEKLHDLLDKNNKNIKIQEDASGNITVSSNKIVVKSAEDILTLMKKGNKIRQIGETNMNERSSRSHTIFRIFIESTPIEEFNSEHQSFQISHINLVDLAGCERAHTTGATGTRLKEGGHINKSLLTLTLVIKQVSEGVSFVNYRDSKLTRILQPCLGGNSKATLIAAVTPTDVDTSQSTLAFAQRAKRIKNKPVVNCSEQDTLIKNYVDEIANLNKQLFQAQSHNVNLARSKEVLEGRIKSLENDFVHNDVPCSSNRRHTIHLASKRVDSVNIVPKYFTPARLNSVTARTGQKLELVPETVEIIEENDETETQELPMEIVKSDTPKIVLRERINTLTKELTELEEFTRYERTFKQDTETLLTSDNKDLRFKLDEAVKRLKDLNKLNTEFNVLQKKLKEAEDRVKANELEYELIIKQKESRFKEREQDLLSMIQSKGDFPISAKDNFSEDILEGFLTGLAKSVKVTNGSSSVLTKELLNMLLKLRKINYANLNDQLDFIINEINDDKFADENADIKILKEKLTKYNDVDLKINRYKSLCNDLKTKIETLEDDKLSILEDKDTLEKELELAKTRCAKETSALNEITGAYKSIQEDGKDLQNKCTVLTEQLQLTEAKYKKENIELNKMSEAYNTLQEEQKQLTLKNQQLQKLSDSNTSDLTELQNRCSYLTEQIQLIDVKYRQENTQSNNALEACNSIQEELKRNYEQLQKQYNCNKSDLTEWQNRCSSLTEQLQLTEAKYRQENIQLTKITEAYSNIQVELKEFRLNNQQHQKLPSDNKLPVIELQNRCTSLTEQLQLTEAKYRQENIQLTKITEAYNNIQVELKELRLNNQQHQKLPSDNKLPLTELQNRCTSLTEQLHLIESKNVKDNTKLNRITDAYNNAQEELKQLIIKNQQLEKDVNSNMPEMNLLQNKCAELTKQLEHTRIKYEDTQSRINQRSYEIDLQSNGSGDSGDHLLLNVLAEFETETVLHKLRDLQDFLSQPTCNQCSDCYKLKQQIATMDMEINNLKRKKLRQFSNETIISKLQEELDEMKAEYKKLTETLNERNTTITRYDHQMAVQKKEFDSCVKNIEIFKTENDSLKAEINTLIDLNNKSREQSNVLKTIDNTANTCIPIDRSSKNVCNKCIRLQKEIEEKENAIGKLTKETSMKSGCVSCKDLSKHFKHLEQQFKQINVSNKKLKEKINLLSENTCTKCCEFQNYNKELQGKLSLTEKELESTNEKIQELNCKIIEMDCVNAQLSKSNDFVTKTLKEENERLKRKLCSKCEKIKYDTKEVQVGSNSALFKHTDEVVLLQKSKYVKDKHDMNLLKDLAKKRKDQILALQDQICKLSN